MVNGEYFYQRALAEPRMTNLSDEAAVTLFLAMINSAKLDSKGDKITFYYLVNDLLRHYRLTIKDLYAPYEESILPKDPMGSSINYESLLTNKVNYNWKEELEYYLDCGLIRSY